MHKWSRYFSSIILKIDKGYFELQGRKEEYRLRLAYWWALSPSHLNWQLSSNEVFNPPLGSLVGRVVNAEVKPVGNTQKGMRKSLPENKPQKLSSLCEAWWIENEVGLFSVSVRFNLVLSPAERDFVMSGVCLSYNGDYRKGLNFFHTDVSPFF